MKTHAKGLLITTFGVLFIVPDALFIRLIEAEPMTIAFWRLFLSGIIIGLGVLATSGLGGFKQALSLGHIAWAYVFFLGASGVLFVAAISLTSVANVVLIIASLPIFSALFSWKFLGERINARTALTIVAVSIGLAIITGGTNARPDQSHLWGDFLALLVAISFAAALTLARSMRAVSMVPLLPLANIGAALAILPFANIWAVAPSSFPLVAAHGGVFIVVSTVLLALGPRYLPSAEVSLLILLESVLAPLLVWAVLGEEPAQAALIGGALILGALVTSNAVQLLRTRQ